MGLRSWMWIDPTMHPPPYAPPIRIEPPAPWPSFERRRNPLADPKLPPPPPGERYDDEPPGPSWSWAEVLVVLAIVAILAALWYLG